MSIKQTVVHIMSGAILVVAGFLFIAPPVEAAECGKVQTSIITCDQTGGDEGMCPDGTTPKLDTTCSDGSKPSAISNNGLWGVLLIAVNILTAGVGVVALGGIVYGAILYISAGGSSEQVKKAMGIFTNVVIGVVAYAGMYALLNFLVPGGVFN